MAFDLQEQEQLDQLKTFWERGGKWLAILVGVLVIAYLGYVGYNYHQKQQMEEAGALFGQFNKALEQQDLDKAKTLGSDLESKHPQSPYASRAALISARIAYDKNDPKAAKDKLLWAAANSQEAEVQGLARLRFAAILLDEKQYAAALTELDKAHDAGLDVQYAELKGDVLQAKGDIKAARASYKLALDKTAKDAPERQVLDIKLAALGE